MVEQNDKININLKIINENNVALTYSKLPLFEDTAEDFFIQEFIIQLYPKLIYFY